MKKGDRPFDYTSPNLKHFKGFVKGPSDNKITSNTHGENLVFRKIEKSDYYLKYIELLSQLTTINKEKITKDKFDNFINNLNINHHIIVAELSDININLQNVKNIVGSVTVLIENKLIHNFGKVAHIEDVVVDKDIRGYGLGKKIIDKAIQYAKNQGCYKIILDCNKDNIKFYEKCGFKHKEYEMVIYL